MGSSRIVLVKKDDRKKAILASLEPLKVDLKKGLEGKRLVIKVNFVSAHNQLAATHVEAVRAFLDFVSPFYKKEILIVERGVMGMGEGFENYGYPSLEDEYRAKTSPHLTFGYEQVSLFNQKMVLEPVAYFSKLAYESNVFLVSIGPAKTHDAGVVTLSLKNISVGLLKNPSIVHQGYQAFNKNLYLLAKQRVADLAIIDATEAMEGNGPASGTLKRAGWVLTSFDSIQADVVATWLMGFDPNKVGYLHYLLEDGLATTEFKNLEIGPASVDECRSVFKPHRTDKAQQGWLLPPNLRQKAEIGVRKVIAKIQAKQRN
ncbi:DUF362 domain-containing protein [Patescibacteria group bacterium]|nr:DUF362 domain-containing protein [Patescibacteria group bacterium]